MEWNWDEIASEESPQKQFKNAIKSQVTLTLCHKHHDPNCCQSSLNLLAYFIVHPMCGNLPSAVTLKALWVFLCLSTPCLLWHMMPVGGRLNRRKVKWGNHSQLKKTEKETSIHFQQFINNCIIPPPQGFFCHFWSFCWVTNPQEFCLIFSSLVCNHIVCQKNLSYKNGEI